MNRQNKTREKNEAGELFRVARGEMSVCIDLYWEYLEQFETACDRLLDSRKSKLVVDLTSVNFISSSFVGCLGSLVLKAARLKKRVILRVTQETSWLFDIMGGQKVLELEIL